MSNYDFLSIEAAPIYAAVATVIATVAGGVRAITSGMPKQIPFLAECGDFPTTELYLLGPDGTGVEIKEGGSGFMPSDWRDRKVLVRTRSDHRTVHAFYFRPVKGELFLIVVQSSP